MVPHIIDSNDVGMVSETSHGPGFPGDTASSSVIQFLRLDEGKGHISIKERIMDEVDLLLATLTQEFLDLVAAIGKGGGLG